MNRICELFGIRYPIISGGMVWCSGWRLASAVSNCGGLGLIGAGSMHPETLREHIRKCKAATGKPFGVNVPLLYPEPEAIMKIIADEGVPAVFTSAGNPKTWTGFLHDHGIKVAHVVSSSKFARKCEDARVDAVVAEGFEAGGHNGREETTTMCLIPQVREAVGLRFCIGLGEGDTFLMLKKVSPTRLARNPFFEQIAEAENRGAGSEELSALLGKGRAKKGIFEGDLDDGELEIGQNVSQFNEILPVAKVMEEIVSEYDRLVGRLERLR